MKLCRVYTLSLSLIMLLLPPMAGAGEGTNVNDPALARGELRTLHELAMEEALGSMTSQEIEGLGEELKSLGLSQGHIETLYAPDGRATWIGAPLPLATPEDLGLEADEEPFEVSLALLDRICPLLGCEQGDDSLEVSFSMIYGG